ncbi:MAG: hypothetical protein AAF467_20860 [Actinomycetota bacterium]
MGAQDTLGLAESFVQETGATTPLMIWDESFATWSYYGVTGQPIAILVDPSGEPITGWRGAADFDEVLRLAAEV